MYISICYWEGAFNMEAGISSKEAIKEDHGIQWLTKKVYTPSLKATCCCCDFHLQGSIGLCPILIYYCTRTLKEHIYFYFFITNNFLRRRNTLRVRKQLSRRCWVGTQWRTCRFPLTATAAIAVTWSGCYTPVLIITNVSKAKLKAEFWTCHKLK